MTDINPDQPYTDEPMLLNLIDGRTGKFLGNTNVAVRVYLDGSFVVAGPVKLYVEDETKDAAFTMTYAWSQPDDAPVFAFRVPGVKKLFPAQVLGINEIVVSKDEVDPTNNQEETP